jgi:hypothetical protein
MIEIYLLKICELQLRSRLSSNRIKKQLLFRTLTNLIKWDQLYFDKYTGITRLRTSERLESCHVRVDTYKPPVSVRSGFMKQVITDGFRDQL